MGAIKDIFGKEELEVGLADIQNLIDQKVEENRMLEYKAPDILANPKRLSEWVSAFLNAEGGLIIIGVCEAKPNEKDSLQARIYPTKIEFVDSKYTRERVEQMIFSNIYCSARPEIRVLPIRDTNDSSKAVFLVEIPRGEDPPYQAADNRYCRRLNVTKYPLAHYEIADFFGRRRRPRLNLQCMVSNPLKRRIPDKNEMQLRSSYHLRIMISNTGSSAAKYARVVVSLENIKISKVTAGPSHRIDDLRNGLPTLQWDNPVGVIYAGTGADVIWELDVRLSRNHWGLITWEAIAEDVDVVRGNWVLLGMETGEARAETKPYLLPSHEQAFGSPPATPLSQSQD